MEHKRMWSLWVVLAKHEMTNKHRHFVPNRPHLPLKGFYLSSNIKTTHGDIYGYI